MNTYITAFKQNILKLIAMSKNLFSHLCRSQYERDIAWLKAEIAKADEINSDEDWIV